MSKLNSKKTALILFACIVLLFATIAFCGCSEVTYSTVTSSDGAYLYDLTIDLSGLDAEQKPLMIDAIKNTVKMLPLYDPEITTFIERDDTLIFRESYKDLTDLYLKRGYTGYEKNSEDSYAITNEGILYKKYTIEYGNVFAQIDRAYSSSVCAETAVENPAYEFATYYDSGIRNIERLLLKNYATLLGWDQDRFDEEMSHGMPSTISALGLSNGASTIIYKFVYGTNKKSITTNAEKVVDNTSTMTPVKDALYKDALYYHVWSGNENEIKNAEFTVSQTSPDMMIWYIMSIIIALILGIAIYLFLRFRSKGQSKSTAPKELRGRTEPLNINDDPFK